MVSEGFPENHDNPTDWPFWSPSHRRIRNLSVQHTQPDDDFALSRRYSPEDISRIKNLRGLSDAELHEVEVELDDEIEAANRSLAEARRYKRLIDEVFSERKTGIESDD